MEHLIELPANDQSWMNDDASCQAWGKEMILFRTELDQVVKSASNRRKQPWLNAIEAARCLIRDGSFYCALPRFGLPVEFPTEGEYLVIEAPFSNIQFLIYSLNQYYLDLYGR